MLFLKSKFVFQALCILLLPIEELSKLYMHIIAAGALAIAIFSAQNFLEGEIYFRAGDNGDNWRYFVWRHVRIFE